MSVGAVSSTAKRWVAGGLLWLAFVGTVFWHNITKHEVAAADGPMVERSVRLLARDLRTDTGTIRRISFPVVSHSEHYDCVILQPLRTDRGGGGRFCYRRTDEKLLEERIFGPVFRGRSVSERIEDAIKRD